jgi:lipopolysaccharide transport protein LptA
VGVALAVVVAVGWSLRNRPPTKPDASAGGESASAPKDVTRFGGLVLRSFKEGQQNYVVEAESSTGKEGAETRFGGVKVTFDCVEGGKKESCVITADDCLFNPAVPRGVFRGHVVLTTSEGFEFRSDSLVYRGDKQLAKTDDRAEFKRKAVSGSARGMVYSAADGKVEMLDEAYVRIEGEAAPPTEINAKTATLDRSEGTLTFEGDTHAKQGDDRLDSARLILTFDTETHVLYQAVAAGGVDLHLSGARPLPGGLERPGARGGARHLLCRRLDISFRQDRSIQQIVTQTDVDLTILPGPGQHAERRRVQAKRYLILDCDEKGRAAAVRAAGDVVMRAEPVSRKETAVPREVRCRRFESALDPETGQASAADFFGQVVFSRDKQRARGDVAHYDGATAALSLGEHPGLDDDSGTLEARSITVGSETGDIAAEGEVRHVLAAGGKGQVGPFGGGDKPTIIASKSFSSVQKTGIATYTGSAVLRSDKNEIRAESITMRQGAEGQRTMHAAENVVSLLNQAPDKNKPGAAAPIACSGDVMDYTEATRQIVYTGNAVVRQGSIVTRSPKATLTLTPDLGGLEKLVAGEPVEITQDDRHATGQIGTYTTADQMVVLVGKEVVLKDSTQVTKARSVAFRVGGDRVIVDGQDEGRTESSFKEQIGGPRP